MNEEKRVVYLVRKSWIDETTELARCSEFELAKFICKPGYSVFDENGVPMYSIPSENRFNHGKKWNNLKAKIEADLIRLDSRKFPFASRKELHTVLHTLFDVLKLMNEVEIEDDREDNKEKTNVKKSKRTES